MRACSISFTNRSLPPHLGWRLVGILSPGHELGILDVDVPRRSSDEFPNVLGLPKRQRTLSGRDANRLGLVAHARSPSAFPFPGGTRTSRPYQKLEPVSFRRKGTTFKSSSSAAAPDPDEDSRWVSSVAAVVAGCGRRRGCGRRHGCGCRRRRGHAVASVVSVAPALAFVASSCAAASSGHPVRIGG